MYQELYREAQAMQDELTTWRHALHQIPERGFDLPQTCAYVQARLTEMGLSYTTLAESNSIVVELGQGEPCLLLRADMDALPMREESGEAFASTNGCMHACGHDLHTTFLLGAAKMLKAHEAELKGTVKLLFQTAEELSEGARSAINHGVLDNPRVDAAMAAHVYSMYPVGTIAYGEYPAAAFYGFKITLTGKGTHGAMPDLGIDPINTAVHIYLALQELIARECPADKQATLTIGQISAGSAFNIIPETAFMQGSLRVFDANLRDHLVKRIGEVIEHVAAAYRTEVTFELIGDIPALHCDNALNAQFADVYRQMSPDIALTPGYKATTSEDFAYVSEHVPTAMFMIGAQVEEGPVYNLHNPAVRFNDKTLPVGAAVYAAAALSWQRNE
ncbi:MAG: M20 family metallopeptidase [Peptococcaceae bacterium]|nr:M20 family metallopeptidase [Peptococcaceae bacterium]